MIAKDDVAVITKELNNVFVRRSKREESYLYTVENQRGMDVRLYMTFSGENYAVTPADGFRQPSSDVVEGVIANGATREFAEVAPQDRSNGFQFSVDIKVFPADNKMKESDLEGVVLRRSIGYDGPYAQLNFEARNNREFDVEVEVELKGHIEWKSGSLPFVAVVAAGKTASVGSIKSDDEIEISWNWKEVRK